MTSAERARTTAYSPDIRWRMVWLRISLEMSIKSIAKRLQVGVATVYRILSRFESTGDVRPTTRTTRYRKLDELHDLYVIGLVAENPGLYLEEMCQKMLPMLLCQLPRCAGYCTGMVSLERR